jgi:general secretion pathway protein I
MTRAGANRRAAQSGFSLLEVLVAFSIMAVSLAMLYQVSGGTVRTVAYVEQNQRAAMLLDSLLSAKDGVLPEGWNDSGESGGFAWQVQSERFATPTSEETPTAVPLHKIVVSVSWRDGVKDRQLAASTLLPQLKPPPAAVIR